jgi:hypothetical protein
MRRIKEKFQIIIVATAVLIFAVILLIWGIKQTNIILTACVTYALICTTRHLWKIYRNEKYREWWINYREKHKFWLVVWIMKFLAVTFISGLFYVLLGGAAYGGYIGAFFVTVVALCILILVAKNFYKISKSQKN